MLGKYLWVVMDGAGGALLGLHKKKSTARKWAVEITTSTWKTPIKIFKAPIEWYHKGELVKNDLLPKEFIDLETGRTGVTWDMEEVIERNRQYIERVSKEAEVQ